MPQQLQTHQSWPDKTIKQAITNNQKTIHLQFIATFPSSNMDNQKTATTAARIGFLIENELNDTGLDGCFDFTVDSHFVQTTLACNEGTTLNEVIKKAVRYIFAHNVEFKENPSVQFARLKNNVRFFEEDIDNITIQPFQGDYHIGFFTVETKSILGIFGKHEIKQLAQIQYVTEPHVYFGSKRVNCKVIT